MKILGIVVLPFCLLASTATLAQSKIDCIVGANGSLHAPLIWQNTLGITRANAICQAQGLKREEASSIRDSSNRREQPEGVAQSRFSNATKERASNFVVDASQAEKTDSFETEFNRAW